MKPPICALCSADFRHEAEEGGLIYFSLTPENEKWHARQKAEGFVGHPPEAAWFCSEHYPAARALSHLTLPEAMQKLRGQCKQDS